MTSAPYQVTDPSTGEVVESFATATDEQIDAALAAAASGYSLWRSMPITERAAIVRRIGELIAERSDDLARTVRQEMGKSPKDAASELNFCKTIYDYFSDNGPALLADQPIDSYAGGTAVVQKLPIGPLLGIMPWNYPFYQVSRFVAPNLMLGNTIILKHAESVPRSALALEQIMKDAGLPDGVYTNVFASHEQIERIIADPRVQGVSLTGSERAGSIVASIAGKNLKKCVLELGGSDPMVVLDTDDLDKLASVAWNYRIYNGGQVCNSNKRMIVMDDIYDDFVTKLTEHARSVDLAEYPPLSSRRAAESLHEQVQDAVSKGATLHAGGSLSDGPGAYYSPGVLTGVTKDMRAYSEELFGPVAVVYKVASDDEALELANDTAYGLGGLVFSTDVERAANVAQRLEVGMANVNWLGEGAEIPFGGVKRSGFGRELGPLAMDEFVNKRLYFVAG
ncbi:MAG TPA: NAD-dependent succinate-semialdehyde dehydrogenase [Microbacterium sp.]|uniref:NAD-dependent succinate-semialdehyde dehydrogenase n=1 Tax=Microbacterium sp. TaxID=51671 RepID=UPI002CB5FCCE|nr:NAD-dependent succinate-semialdehyde dehydrogenase [Microbacterium sp.]HWI30004.1 NAD-dependent succinate-semialdehyde dehydrogenase [Microbacterium sp.]